MNILIHNQKEERTLCKRASICIFLFVFLIFLAPFVSAYCFMKNNLSSMNNSDEIVCFENYSKNIKRSSGYKINNIYEKKIVDLSKFRKSIGIKITVSIFSILLGLFASPFIEILCLILILSYIPIYLMISK